MLGRVAIALGSLAVAFLAGRQSLSTPTKENYSERFLELMQLNNGCAVDELLESGQCYIVESKCIVKMSGMLVVATESGVIELHPVRLPHVERTRELVERYENLIPNDKKLCRMHSDRYRSANSSSTFVVLRRIIEKEALTNTSAAVLVKE